MALIFLFIVAPNILAAITIFHMVRLSPITMIIKTLFITLQRNLQLISPALSLGGVESLICSPVFTSHRYLTREERMAIGINDNLLRMSVGIEDANDLINDLKTAIEKTV